MRTSTAYFAGVGTVIFAVGAGLGGGYLAANIAHPPVQTVSKLERRMSAEPIPVSTAPAETVPYAAAPAPTNSNPAPAQEQQQAQPQPTQAAAPANAAPAEEKTPIRDVTTNNNVAVAQPAPSPPQPSKAVEQADDRSAAPRESYARASDVDVKRAAAEKRRAERRQQQWTDKRRWKQPREQQPRDQELDVVEERVREATEPRRIRIREEGEPRGFFGEVGRRDMFAEPARSEAPRIRLFDQDD